MTGLAPPPPSLGWSLFLDVDGTLLDIADSPSEARVDPGLAPLLGQVATRLGGAVALVSGRNIETLDAFFAPLRLPTSGLHGVERRKATGALQGASFVDAQLDRARVALKTLVATHTGTLLEDKGRTLAVHYRMAPQFADEVREAVATIVAQLGPNYQVQPGSMLLEIKPRGFDKGAAVKAFLNEPPFSGRLPVFVGDDLTDLDGFRVVEDYGGISIGVGNRVQGQYHLADPRAVRDWLEGIAELVDSHRA